MFLSQRDPVERVETIDSLKVPSNSHVSRLRYFRFWKFCAEVEFLNISEHFCSEIAVIMKWSPEPHTQPPVAARLDVWRVWTSPSRCLKGRVPGEYLGGRAPGQRLKPILNNSEHFCSEIHGFSSCRNVPFSRSTT